MNLVESVGLWTPLFYEVIFFLMERYLQTIVLHTMVAWTMSLLRMKYSFTCGFCFNYFIWKFKNKNILLSVAVQIPFFFQKMLHTYLFCIFLKVLMLFYLTYMCFLFKNKSLLKVSSVIVFYVESLCMATCSQIN